MKTCKIKIDHKVLGTITIKMDAEDKHLIEGKRLNVKCWLSQKGHNPIITVREIPCSNPSNFVHLSRLILNAHNMLDNNKNVFFKNKDCFDYTKKNLLCGKKFI